MPVVVEITIHMFSLPSKEMQDIHFKKNMRALLAGGKPRHEASYTEKKIQTNCTLILQIFLPLVNRTNSPTFNRTSRYL